MERIIEKPKISSQLHQNEDTATNKYCVEVTEISYVISKTEWHAMLYKAVCNELVLGVSKAQQFTMFYSKSVKGLAYWNSILYLKKFIEVMKVPDKSSCTAKCLLCTLHQIKWRDEYLTHLTAVNAQFTRVLYRM